MISIAPALPHPVFGSIGLKLSSTAKSSPAQNPRFRTPALENMRVEFDEANRTCWCYMAPQDRASFTPALLADMSAVQSSFRQYFSECQAEPELKYIVVGSDTHGIFNLGGDLGLFSDLIRTRNTERLRSYAMSCIDVIYGNATSYELPVITIALVQGDALGGGFEAALSCDLIVAERQARFGLPEILFNLFPGMGAYSFLSRRLDAREARKLIISGKIFTAGELQEMGLVDILVEEGEGPAAIRSYISRHSRRHGAEQAVYRVGRRVNPVTYEELRDVTEIWVETAMRLTEQDLRKMERIMAAQQRRWISRLETAVRA